METLELNIFYWSKDAARYEKVIERLIREGWERRQPDVPYLDTKDCIYKWETNLIRLVGNKFSITIKAL